MNKPSSTSILSVLSLYTGLRRSGANQTETQQKLQGLISQLSLADRQELTKSIEDWEAKQGKKLDGEAAGSDPQQARVRTSVFTPATSQLFGASEFDRKSSENAADMSSLRPFHTFITCPKCGEKNDAANTKCANCGNRLVTEGGPSRLLEELTWFGPDSRLMLTVDQADEPIEMTVRSLLTLGRGAINDQPLDVDLSRYGADGMGVSRLHASIKRQNNTLTLTDMQSTNHTFVNGKRLREGEVYTLKSGDQIHLGRLALRVLFKRNP